MSISPLVGRVAALYDIHGNLPALEAALLAIERANVSLIVVGGDVVLGPMPAQVLERLAVLETPIQYLRGNCDRLVIEATRGELSGALPAPVRAMIEWAASQLSPTQVALLASLPMMLRVETRGLGAVRFCHATPHSDEEIVTPRTPGDRMRSMLAGVAETWIVVGHTHVQFRRRVGPWEFINAGSVGMSTAAAEAHWLLLGSEAAWQQTAYDAEAAIAAITAASYPGAREFIGAYIERSPTPESVWAMLEQ